mgnify:CR=1 FL=1
MTALFLKILNMSITAGWITVAVMFFRILLKKMPKHFTCMLWALVGLRLVIPFSPESVFSLIPSAETIPETLPHGAIPEIHSGISTIDRMVNPAAKISFSQLSAGRSGAEALDILADGAVILWLAGVLLMLCHMILSYLRLRRKMRTAVLLRDNIWQSEFAASPFLLGLASPRIYVPFHMDRETLSHVIAHENAHLARKDHLVKAFAFCLLSVYWFHPLLWAAYALLCRDIELACDERVIRNMEEKERKNYLLALIGYNNEEHKKNPTLTCPLSFGEVDIKERILRAKTWKKPGAALLALSLLLCAAAALCFLTDPKEKLLTAPEPFGRPYQVESIAYAALQYNFSFTPQTAPLYVLTSDYQLMESSDTPVGLDKSDGYWALCGKAEEVRLTEKDLKNYITEYPDPAAEETFVHELIKENKKTWVVDSSSPDNPIFYYIMQQKTGETYLSYGYQAQENPHIRWIFKLSPIKEESLSAETLHSHRTKYIGDNSAVGNIIYNLTFPEDMAYRQFALQTDDEEPYAVTITFALSEENKEEYALDAPNRLEEVALLRQNACILFSLIENAEIVNFKLMDEADDTIRPLTLVYTKQWAETETNCDLWKESETKEQFEVLLIKLRELFSPYVHYSF